MKKIINIKNKTSIKNSKKFDFKSANFDTWKLITLKALYNLWLASKDKQSWFSLDLIYEQIKKIAPKKVESENNTHIKETISAILHKFCNKSAMANNSEFSENWFLANYHESGNRGGWKLVDWVIEDIDSIIYSENLKKTLSYAKELGFKIEPAFSQFFNNNYKIIDTLVQDFEKSSKNKLNLKNKDYLDQLKKLLKRARTNYLYQSTLKKKEFEIDLVFKDRKKQKQFALLDQNFIKASYIVDLFLLAIQIINCIKENNERDIKKWVDILVRFENNILLLPFNYDLLFDLDLISFNDLGIMQISANISKKHKEQLKVLGIDYAEIVKGKIRVKKTTLENIKENLKLRNKLKLEWKAIN